MSSNNQQHLKEFVRSQELKLKFLSQSFISITAIHYTSLHKETEYISRVTDYISVSVECSQTWNMFILANKLHLKRIKLEWRQDQESETGLDCTFGENKSNETNTYAWKRNVKGFIFGKIWRNNTHAHIYVHTYILYVRPDECTVSEEKTQSGDVITYQTFRHAGYTVCR